MSQPSNHTAAWEWTGIIAAMIIVISLPIYYLQTLIMILNLLF